MDNELDEEGERKQLLEDEGSSLHLLGSTIHGLLDRFRFTECFPSEWYRSCPASKVSEDWTGEEELRLEIKENGEHEHEDK